MKKETGFFYNPVSIFRGKVALWEFDSLHCVKKGVWHLRKNLVVFYPPECQKTQEIPGFFGCASFLHYLSGAGSRSRTGTPSLAADFESATSTNSIIPATVTIIIIHSLANCKWSYGYLSFFSDLHEQAKESIPVFYGTNLKKRWIFQNNML